MIDELGEGIEIGLLQCQVLAFVAKFIGDVSHHQSCAAGAHVEDFDCALRRIINHINERVAEQDLHFFHQWRYC